MNWYYALNNQQLGPVPEAELARLAAAGTIEPGTLVWREGQGDWQPLATACPLALGAPGSETPQISGFALPEANKDLIVQQMREGVLGRNMSAVHYAGFWIRVAAVIIDGLIMSVPTFVLFMVLGFVINLTRPTYVQGQPPEAPPVMMIVLVLGTFALIIALQVLYQVGLVAKYGATWGKMALGLRIVTEDGGPITTGRAIGRFFAQWVSGLTLYIGFIMAGFDAEKRTLHDHICSTRVIWEK